MIKVTEFTDTEITITEHYAVETYRTARGYIAEIKDVGSPYRGLYALGSNKECAIASLALKVSRTVFE